MSLRITFKDNQAGIRFRFGFRRFAERVSRAAVATAKEAARLIEKRGRADIRTAGKFGKRWTDGLHAVPEVEHSEDAGLRIKVTHDVPYASIFVYGGIIKGKPLLWIPLSFATDALGKRARDYPGGLFRVDRKGGKAPLLLSVKDGEPKYFGKASVRIPKKFRLIEIIREVSHSFRDIYRKRYAAEK